MRPWIVIALIVTFAGCNNSEQSATTASASAASSATPAPPPDPTPTTRPMGNTVLDVALGSKDHTTLVTAIKATDLETPLSSPGGIYTVFAPTNAAFDKLPKGTVEGLLKPDKKADLKKIVQHHAAVPTLQVKDFKDGQKLGMSDGTSVTLHVKDGKVTVENANIIASVTAANGVVHVIDAVLLPPSN